VVGWRSAEEGMNDSEVESSPFGPFFSINVERFSYENDTFKKPAWTEYSRSSRNKIYDRGKKETICRHCQLGEVG